MPPTNLGTRPAASPLAPINGLPPRPVTWLRDTVAVMALGTAAAGGALIASLPLIAVLAVVGGGTAGWLTAKSGRRANARGELADRATEALAPELGWRSPDRRQAKFVKWGEGTPGRPGALTLKYSPKLKDDEPGWTASLVEVANRRLQAEYKVTKHDRGKCIVRMKAVQPCAAEETPVLLDRAERTIAGLLGSSAAVKNPLWKDEDTLAGFTVRYDVETGLKLTAGGYKLQVERRTSAMLPGRWRAKWDPETDLVEFQLRPELPDKIDHPILEIDAENLYKLPYAFDEDLNTICWNLLRDPHLLGTGKTGRGKTVAFNGLIMECARRQWRVWIADPKEIEFIGLKDWPNVQIVATTIEEIVAVIHHAKLEMDLRYEMTKMGVVKSEAEFEPLIVVLDEMSDLIRALKGWWPRVKPKGSPAQCPILDEFYSLAAKARSANIHLIVGMQRPDVALLSGGGSGGGDARDNFTARLSLGRLSRDGAIMMWEEAWPLACSVPSQIKGRGSAPSHTDPDLPSEVQVFWTPDPRRSSSPEDLALLELLRPETGSHPKLAVKLSDEFLDPEDGSEPRIWDAVRTSRLIELAPSEVAESARIPEQLLAPAQDETDGSGQDHEVDEADGYGPVTYMRVSKVSSGDLIQTEDNGPWLEVGLVEPDIADGDYIYIDWTDANGCEDSMSCPDSMEFAIRRPEGAGNA